MAADLKGRKVAFLATDGVERVELMDPWNAVKQAGGEPRLVSLRSGEIQTFNHDDKADRLRVDDEVSAVSVWDFDALVIPGGTKSPDRLRTNPAAVQLVRDFVESDKPVASICHGPWMLVEAGVVKGRTLTSWPSLQTDVRNAGGDWVDREFELDQKLLTSRKPEDLPAFCAQLTTLLSSAIDERRLDRMVEQTFPASDPLPGPIAI